VQQVGQLGCELADVDSEPSALLGGVLVVADRTVDRPVHRAQVENVSGMQQLVVGGAEPVVRVVEFPDDPLIGDQQCG